MMDHWWQQLAGKRVLVVGGSGFLGLNFVMRLLEARAYVRATGEGHIEGIEWLGRTDFAEMNNVKRALKDQDLVINCIGKLGAAASNLQPTVSLEQELRPQLNLLLGCAESTPSPALLLISSRLVYGRPCYLPVNEAHALQPESFYAIHKATAESYARLLGRTHGLRSCIFRLANPYGPYQKFSCKSYGVINYFLQRAASGAAIDVYGNGKQTRDYIYSQDVVEAMLRCAPYCEPSADVFNLGSGVAIPLFQAAEIITGIAGSPAVKYLSWPEEELMVETGNYVSDLARIRDRIGTFIPLSFERGAELTINHYRSVTQPVLSALESV